MRVIKYVMDYFIGGNKISINPKNYLKFLFIILLFVCLIISAGAQVTGLRYVPPSGETIQTTPQSFVSQRNITWYFDREYEVGQFVSGEHFVIGPVVITRIEPDFINGQNGWEVNPTVKTSQGFSIDNPYYDSNEMPDLPYVADYDQSVVKVIGGEFRHSNILEAEVLTVLMQTPPVGTFRPPYIGTGKPLYNKQDLRTDLLPSYSKPPGYTPLTLDDVIRKFSLGLRMDHHPTHPRYFRPGNVMYDYQPGNTEDINEAILRLMLDDPLEDKMGALIQFTQACIDRGYAILNGYTQGSTGHNPNHRIMAGWAAAILDISIIADELATNDAMHEDYYIVVGNEGQALWGMRDSTEWNYWAYVMGLGGARSHSDPYRYIDGGSPPGESYQHIVSQSWKGQVLATLLMPALSVSWNPSNWPYLSDYVDRWVTHGALALPDPIAPYDGNNDNYGITYGPDESTGDPILGSGRFPEYDGTNTDGGQYRSEFVAAMWNAYRN